MTRIWLTGIFLLQAVFLYGGCGGAAIPQQELTTAKAQITGAEVGGAADEPKAAFHLQRAKQQITQAEKLIEDGDNEEAARVIERAHADADLALSLAKAAKAKAEAADAQAQLEKLEKKSK